MSTFVGRYCNASSAAAAALGEGEPFAAEEVLGSVEEELRTAEQAQHEAAAVRSEREEQSRQGNWQRHDQQGVEETGGNGGEVNAEAGPEAKAPYTGLSAHEGQVFRDPALVSELENYRAPGSGRRSGGTRQAGVGGTASVQDQGAISAARLHVRVQHKRQGRQAEKG